jgi:hypothetical protein
LQARAGPVKKPAGYQAALVCLTPWVNNEAPSSVTCLSLGPPAFGLLAYGNGSGLVIVDHIQQKGGTRINRALHIGEGGIEDCYQPVLCEREN